MTTPRPNTGTTTRQKLTIALIIIVSIFLIWQLWGLFGGDTITTPAPVSNVAQNAQPGTAASTAPPITMASVPRPAPITPQEAELLRQQQQQEQRYIETVTNLQMLELQRQIAETNKAIMAAKFDTITAEKNIVDLLSPPKPVTPTAPNYAAGLVVPTGTQPTVPSPTPPAPIPATDQGQPSSIENYTVVSVTLLNYKWNAVLGYGGNLYSVQVGDILPTDQSKVISIDRSGVVLQKEGIRRKVSLVPII